MENYPFAELTSSNYILKRKWRANPITDMFRPMSTKQKLSALLAFPGWTQARVAAKLGVSQSTVNRWTTGTAPEGDHRDALADLINEVFGLSVENNKMRVRGEIGAGQLVRLIDRADQEWVDRPPSRKTLVALRVAGDVMLPYFADGWIILHSDPDKPENIVGEIVIAELADGRQIVRKLQRGSATGLWTLTIPSASDIADVEIERVFPLEWIKPYTSSVLPF